MRFKYCPHCGTKAIERSIGDEGLVLFCEKCDIPLFDMFSSAVIVLVVNDEGKVALLRQNYISTQYRNLVSGYMKPGETAEETARREVMEEIGISLNELRLIGTKWFEPKDMLMIGFIGYAENTDFKLSGEVNSVEWVSSEDAIHMVHPNAPGNASYFLVETYLHEGKTGRTAARS